MKALVGAFNQEKALVGAFSVIVQLHRLIDLRHYLVPIDIIPTLNSSDESALRSAPWLHCGTLLTHRQLLVSGSYAVPGEHSYLQPIRGQGIKWKFVLYWQSTQN